jgi:hypothetical protein
MLVLASCGRDADDDASPTAGGAATTAAGTQAPDTAAPGTTAGAETTVAETAGGDTTAPAVSAGCPEIDDSVDAEYGERSAASCPTSSAPTRTRSSRKVTRSSLESSYRGEAALDGVTVEDVTLAGVKLEDA